MSFAPALILRKRTQSGMVRIYDNLIAQLSADAVEVPSLWSGLIDDVGDHAGATQSRPKEAGNGHSLKANSEIYFPLPANREQRRIVEAIDQQRGVLVQGPPGTGKSHTIANLMCHLLATGKRVLITAETGRALQVLKNKLPKEIQPLCVSLLGQGGDAFAELNTAVQGITTRQAAYSPGADEERTKEIDQDLDKARRRLAQLETEIRSLREEETCSQSIADGVPINRSCRDRPGWVHAESVQGARLAPKRLRRGRGRRRDSNTPPENGPDSLRSPDGSF